jgi:hypothetical protein
MADYYRDVVRLLRDAGYEFKRQGRGDHEKFGGIRERACVSPLIEN